MSSSVAQHHTMFRDDRIFASDEFRNAVLEIVIPLIKGWDLRRPQLIDLDSGSVVLPSIAPCQVMEDARHQLGSLAEKHPSIEAGLQEARTRDLKQREPASVGFTVGNVAKGSDNGQTPASDGFTRACVPAAPTSVTISNRQQQPAASTSTHQWAAISSIDPSMGLDALGSSETIKENFFNLQHRAYIAVNDVERNFNKPMGKVLKRSYATLLLLAMVILAAFMSWGFYKVIRSTKYAEIHREEREWISDSMPLPRIGYKLLSPGFSARIQRCSIRAGNYSTKHCEELVTHQCNIGARHGFVCFPSGLHVLGTFGDPMYRYVELGVSRNTTRNTTTPSVTDVAHVDVSWEQHITLFHNASLAQLYSGSLHDGIAHEVFFQKVVSILGTSLGFAGRQGEDESQQLLPSEEAMSRVYEYSRMKDGYGDSDYALSVFFRAHWSQREDFYESYSILRLLETSGGLWTSLLSIISGFAWTSAIASQHCIRCFRRCCLKEGTPAPQA